MSPEQLCICVSSENLQSYGAYQSILLADHIPDGGG